MNPRELMTALLRGDDLAVRQMVKDATRAGFSWGSAPAPDFPTHRRAMAAYAGLVEHLASLSGVAPPEWTQAVGAAPKPVYLVRSAKHSAAGRRWLAEESPEPLKKRNVLATAQ